MTYIEENGKPPTTGTLVRRAEANAAAVPRRASYVLPVRYGEYKGRNLYSLSREELEGVVMQHEGALKLFVEERSLVEERVKEMNRLHEIDETANVPPLPERYRPGGAFGARELRSELRRTRMHLWQIQEYAVAVRRLAVKQHRRLVKTEKTSASRTELGGNKLTLRLDQPVVKWGLIALVALLAIEVLGGVLRALIRAF